MVPSFSGICHNCPNTCLTCKPLLGLSKYLLNKGGNTGDSVFLYLLPTPFLCLLILLFFTHVTFSHFTLRIPIVGQVGQWPFNLGWPEGRVLMPVITETPSFSSFNREGATFIGVWSSILTGCGLSKWLVRPRSWGISHYWVCKD